MPPTQRLSALFKPESVAVIGASGHAGKVGYIIPANLVGAGYSGAIYPVNAALSDTYPRTILGLTAYRKLTDIPAGALPLDLAAIRLPAAKTPAVMEELGGLSTRAAVVIAPGFEEAARPAAIRRIT